MTRQEVMSALRASGTEQNRKIYRRHGIAGDCYGVSFADLEKLRKRIKTDHALAEELWRTGNADARHLATMIADPAQATSDVLDEWAGDLDYYMIADLFARHLASKTPLARKKMEAWVKSGDEWVARAGWTVLALLAQNAGDLSDEYLEACLERIERGIHTAKNRVRDAMNSALIAIGIRNAVLREKALRAARRIGRVEVDHGETGCKTPDAAGYIEKTWRFRSQRRTGGASRGRRAGT